MMFSSAVRNSGIISKVVCVAVAALLIGAAAMFGISKTSAQTAPTILDICSEFDVSPCLVTNFAPEIVCEVHTYLNQNFESVGGVFETLGFTLPTNCDSGEEQPTPEEQCALDERFWNGESCEDVAQCVEGETYNAEDNSCTPAQGGEGEENENTGGNTENNGGGSSTSSGGGGLSGGGSMGGLVLGASTDEVCADPLITNYMGMGKTNDLAEVVKLQLFLNKELGLTLPITGVFGADTKDAVEQFQVKYASEILAPWVPFGLMSDKTPTGYVYKTTKRMINKIHCAALDIPMPQLP